MTEDIFERLAAPFPADAISWRVGNTNINKQTGKPPEGKTPSGMALAYLDARDVMDRLDLVCGPAGWQCDYPHANGKTVCRIGVKVGDEWVWKADGAGDTDIEAEKGALSDSFKRAAVRWGVGRYLYGLPSPWVTIEPMGRSWRIKDSEHAKLRALLNNYAGGPVKTSAAAKRDGDFEHFKERLANADDMETLGAIGREIRAALPMMPAAMRDPLQDAYLQRREELLNTDPARQQDEEFRAVSGPPPSSLAGRGTVGEGERV